MLGAEAYPNVEPGPYYDVEYFHGHAQMSNQLYEDIQSGCTDDELRGNTPLVKGTKCYGLIDDMADEVGVFFAYNLYNACPAGTMAAQRRAGQPAAADKHGLNRALRARRWAGAATMGGAGGDASGVSSPCLGTAMNEWFLLPQTLKAIGAPEGSAFINLDNGHGFNYTSNQEFVGPIYTRALKAGLHVLVYEGDVDACGLQTSNVEDVFVPLFNADSEMTRKWRPWTTDGAQQMGGYVIEWQNRTAQFVSVRGSGHLVPLNRPHVSEVMINAFTSGQPLPELHKAVRRATAEGEL